jgi:hypothetical protein
LVELFVLFSGASLLPLIVWLAASGRSRIVAALMVAVSSVFFSSRVGGFTVAQAFLLSLWLVTTPFFLLEFWSCRGQWASPRDPFVFLWAVGFFGMMALVMDWVAVRYLLIVTPAVAIIAVRLLEIRHPEWTWHTLPAVALAMAILGAGLGYADYRQARTGRDVLPWLENFHPAGRRYYLGDVFTANYLREAGWEPVFADTEMRVGDVVLGRVVTTPTGRFMPRRPVWKEVARLDLTTRFPIKVMDVPASGGFYASLWGALPFTFSTGPWESFRLYEVMAVPSETNDAAR